ncbi:helix-loop-helix DNA-binding domain-containing protein [Gilbertella persicaria]|uniref:helix-loop-helix DNA-binding domain-containing protein n=1 Tax=Gilbertella persicaria TaxID=101096 RepID=UPI002220F013|nr:helix-loop-helix DNA-binding domain-containing protein [Gilbertella persicaria]KAI8049120.1 helix-loop-helix DNA-binding domain-containing protein [Gilbertella persicaria]
MEEDTDSEEDSSQDGSTPTTPATQPKRPITQALFLNFTSDLSPQKMSKKKSKPKKQTAYRVNGVNILNRNNLDSKTAIERIQRRRENHNHVERRRRDNINNTIFELSSVVPNAIQPGQKPNKGNILKLSLDYIRVGNALPYCLYLPFFRICKQKTWPLKNAYISIHLKHLLHYLL